MTNILNAFLMSNIYYWLSYYYTMTQQEYAFNLVSMAIKEVPSWDKIKNKLFTFTHMYSFYAVNTYMKDNLLSKFRKTNKNTISRHLFWPWSYTKNEQTFLRVVLTFLSFHIVLFDGRPHQTCTMDVLLSFASFHWNNHNVFYSK